MANINKGRTQAEWSQMINYIETRKMAEIFNFANSVTENVYRAIRSFKDNKEHTAFPELQTIADVCGHTKKTVIKHIRILERLGVIMKQRRKRRNRRGILRDTSNMYVFVAEKLGRAVRIGMANREVIIIDDAEDKKAPEKLSPLQRLEFVKAELLELGDFTKKQINRVCLNVKEEIRKGTCIQSVSSYVYKALENLLDYERFRSEDRERLKAIREFNAGYRDSL